jgi:hypothetical protein
LTNFPTIFWALPPLIIFYNFFRLYIYIFMGGTQKWVTTIWTKNERRVELSCTWQIWLSIITDNFGGVKGRIGLPIL